MGQPPTFTAAALYERWIYGVTREAYFAEPPPDPKEEEEPEDDFWGEPQPTADPKIWGSPNTTIFNRVSVVGMQHSLPTTLFSQISSLASLYPEAGHRALPFNT